MLRRMAGAATDAHVLSVEGVSRSRMVEALRGWVPVNHLEVDPVVIRMAFDAGHTRCGRTREGGVKPLVLLQLDGDFLVTFQTAELRAPCGDCVTLYAICVSIQALVCAGDGPW